MDAPKKMAVDWTKLPKELMGIVAERLGHRDHLIPFRAVCKAWRNAVTFPAPPSQACRVDIPFPVSVESESDSDSDSDEESDGKLDGSACFKLFLSTLMYLEPEDGDGGWVVRLYRDSLPPGQTIHLRDPISQEVFKKLPKKCPASLNPLDYKFTVISETYSLHPVGIDPPDTDKTLALKVAVSVSPFAVMTIRDVPHSINNKLAVWRSGEEKWNIVGDGTSFMDVTWFAGKFYAVDSTGRAVSVDPASLEVTEVAAALHSADTTEMHMLESLGLLYLFELNDFEDEYNTDDDVSEKPMLARVRRLDEENREWALVKDLENRAFFVGDGSSSSASVEDCPLLHPNTMYFNDSTYAFYHHDGNDYPGSLSSIFSIMDGEVVKLDDETCENYVKVFWPAPTWLVV